MLFIFGSFYSFDIVSINSTLGHQRLNIYFENFASDSLILRVVIARLSKRISNTYGALIRHFTALYIRFCLRVLLWRIRYRPKITRIRALYVINIPLLNLADDFTPGVLPLPTGRGCSAEIRKMDPTWDSKFVKK